VLDRFFTVLTITSSFLVRFWARKVSNRSSHCALQNGPGAVSSIQFSVWSTVRSNLGQTWSTLVEFGQNSPNSGKCIPNRVSRVFGPGGPQSGWERLGQTLVKLRSTLVKLGQPWSNLGKCVLDLLLRSACDQASLDHTCWVRVAPPCVPTLEKILWVKMGL
jgi:hypothetical protein